MRCCAARCTSGWRGREDRRPLRRGGGLPAGCDRAVRVDTEGARRAPHGSWTENRPVPSPRSPAGGFTAELLLGTCVWIFSCPRGRGSIMLVRNPINAPHALDPGDVCRTAVAGIGCCPRLEPCLEEVGGCLPICYYRVYTFYFKNDLVTLASMEEP
eukprot:365852-Chlamydomonas_euryale.AAC.6